MFGYQRPWLHNWCGFAQLISPTNAGTAPVLVPETRPLELPLHRRLQSGLCLRLR